MVRKHLKVTGVVQGVGFRPFAHRLAQRHGLGGWILNNGSGVEIEVEGDADRLAAFLRDLSQECPALGRMDGVAVSETPPLGQRRFEIRQSQAREARCASIPPDVATCPDCTKELLDPADRRHRYPFINCTQCGPRFTIVEEVPYDRPHTTMRPFAMCARCAAEYAGPADRRFHAEPIACPACGPALSWKGANGETRRGEEALRRAVRLIAAGGIVALKGLGGFHIACDAANAAAVRKLRARKDRPAKPFAVMSRSAAEVARYAEVTEAERRVLEAPEHPIVLVRKRPGGTWADGVAPGLGEFGVMLAYTPLHLLLFESGAAFVALVMTSGNRRDEPIARTNEEAEERLSGIADGFLFHDRPIHNRADDSIVRVLPNGQPQLLRRARGFVPAAVPAEVGENIFAAGAELKSSFCLTRAGEAFLSQYLGDLDDERTLAFYRESFVKYLRLLGLCPETVACDLHPDYLSTRFAEEYAERNGLPLLRIQHHEAHVASVLAEHRCAGEGRVLGVAFDGAGYGADGAAWGGEFFSVEPATGTAERVAHLEYFPLPGGDAAVREVWRAALGVLSRSGLQASCLGSLAEVPAARRAAVLGMLDTGVNAPPTSSIGRLFDAAAVLAGLGASASYEAEAAMRLEATAGADFTPYPFAFSTGTPAQVLLADLVRAMAADAGVADRLAARFHATLAEIIRAVALRAQDDSGVRTVALSGGVFQNRLLTRLACAKLEERGFQVLLNRRVPPNDGGLALGQAWLAARRRR